MNKICILLLEEEVSEGFCLSEDTDIVSLVYEPDRGVYKMYVQHPSICQNKGDSCYVYTLEKIKNNTQYRFLFKKPEFEEE